MQSSALVSTGDHPRVCGEKSLLRAVATHRAGSPPRVRGKAAGSSRRRGRPGITPACAGKSCVSSAMRWMIRDHPRVCGEKSAMLSCRFAPQGSPPRVRGKGHCFLHLDFQKGITPARAGKSTARYSHCANFRDHPRACGEKCVLCELEHHLQGSPPRVRGKGGARLRHHPDPGITPARAGKSLSMRVSHSTAQDHPRACGEKSAAMQNNLAREGSPPRVRGKVRHFRFLLACRGITPARAGKRRLSNRRLGRAGDHPRACGEKNVVSVPLSPALGSPPRVRGKGLDQNQHPEYPGITPARAGKRDSNYP